MSATENKDLQLFALDPKQQRFIQLYLTGNFTLAQIAKLLEIHPNTAGKWMKRQDIKNALEEAQQEIHEQVTVQLKSMTLKATQKLNNLIDSPQDAIALQAVKDVLDRGGHKPKNEIKVDKTVTTVEQQLKQLVDTTIDIEFEEVLDEQDDQGASLLLEAKE